MHSILDDYHYHHLLREKKKKKTHDWPHSHTHTDLWTEWIMFFVSILLFFSGCPGPIWDNKQNNNNGKNKNKKKTNQETFRVKTTTKTAMNECTDVKSFFFFVFTTTMKRPSFWNTHTHTHKHENKVFFPSTFISWPFSFLSMFIFVYNRFQYWIRSNISQWFVSNKQRKKIGVCFIFIDKMYFFLSMRVCVCVCYSSRCQWMATITIIIMVMVAIHSNKY